VTLSYVHAVLTLVVVVFVCPALQAQQSAPSITIETSPMIGKAVPVSFPTESQAVSPDGRYAIVGVDGDSEPYHSVWMDDRVLKTRQKLFVYDRHIVLLWDNESKSFAVTDYVGSNTSRCKVFSVNRKAPTIQVLNVLLPALFVDARERLKKQLSNHHVYVEAFVWSGSNVLTVKVSGYGDADPTGFEQFYNVNLHAARPVTPD
jgi:hypothetical protein